MTSLANLSGKSVPVLVTAIGGGGYGGQILKALRLAPAGRYHITGGDAQKDCPQFAMVDEAVLLPLANDPAYVDTLLAICEERGIRALFIGCEPELKIVSAAREKFTARGIFLPMNPAELIVTCMNKELTNKMLADLGFDPPRFMRAENSDSLRAVDFFPVIVKPSVGGGGSANVFIAQDQRELLALADYLGLDAQKGAFLIQEYVGTPESEYTVGVLHDMDGNYINSIAVHRYLSGQLNIRSSVPNRTGRVDLGSKLVVSSGVSHGFVGRFSDVTRQCREIAKAIGARGAINIQCRFVNGKVKVFEINPRFSGTTSLRAMMGYNEPDVLVRRHLMGEEIKVDFPYEEGVVLRGLTEYKIDKVAV